MAKILKARHRRPAQKVETQPKRETQDNQSNQQPAPAGRD